MRHSKTRPTTQTGERPALSVVVRWREGEGAERVETTTLHGATPRSATLTLEGQPELGQLLCLILPSAARRAGASEKSENLNRLWALVWAVSRAAARGDEAPARHNHVSVVFLGGEAPAHHDEQRAGVYAYLAEDDGRFRLQQGVDGADAAAPDSQRRDSRLMLPIEVTVELLNEDGSTSAREQTVTENISRRGACVWTMFGVGQGSFVRLTCERQNVSLISVVRARRTGDDGIGRLHLEFVDGQWPFEPNN